MQSKNTGSNDSPSNKKKPKYRSQALAVILFLVSVFNFILVGAYVSGEMEIKPSLLILKRDGCDVLRQYGIPMEKLENAESCKISAPFRANRIGSSARIFMEDREINIAENQIIAVATLTDQPWSKKQQRLMMLLAACFAIVLGIAAWISVLFG